MAAGANYGRELAWSVFIKRRRFFLDFASKMNPILNRLLNRVWFRFIPRRFKEI